MPTLRSAPTFGGGATVRPDTAGVPDLNATVLANSEGVLVGVEDGALKTTSGTTPSTPQHTTAGAANAAVTHTFAAVAGQAHRLTFLLVSYSGGPTGGRITVTDGATTVLDAHVTAAGPTVLPLPPGGLKGSVNTAMTVTLAAGGLSIVGKLNTGLITA